MLLYDTCNVEELLWNRLTYGDFNKFKPKRKGDLYQMNGIQFEVFLSKFFVFCGYLVEKTSICQDFGADLIMYKYGIKYGVQAKRRKQIIGIKAVQEVFNPSARDYYQANKAMVITTNKFSRNAVKQAEMSNVEL